MALICYFLTPASEPKLTNTDEVQEAIRGLKVSKDPGPNGIPNMALNHLPQRAVSLLPIFSVRFSSPITSLQCESMLDVISILRPGKDPALPSYYRPNSPLDTIG